MFSNTGFLAFWLKSYYSILINYNKYEEHLGGHTGVEAVNELKSNSTTDF